jgi:hypothetical protein
MQKVFMILSKKKKKKVLSNTQKHKPWVRGIAQVVERLPKCEALTEFDPSTIKNKKKYKTGITREQH